MQTYSYQSPKLKLRYLIKVNKGYNSPKISKNLFKIVCTTLKTKKINPNVLV